MVAKDELTGLLNRKEFEKCLEEELAAAKKYDRLCGLLLINIDNFKGVNDTLGNKVGDALLKSVAKCLQRNIRQSDIIARVDGDEFGIILRRILDVKDAGRVAQKILMSCNDSHSVNQHNIHITFTIGVACYLSDGKDSIELFKHADIALYRAKEIGNNNYQYFTEEYNKVYAKRLNMANDLSAALEKNELFLVYQPQFKLPDKKLSGLEVLMQWQHPKLGLVPPIDFIQVAEKNGLMPKLGAWALAQACQQCEGWRKAGYQLGSLAVNLSTVQLKQADFISFVSRTMKETNMNPRDLEFELTESTVMTCLKNIEPVLQQIHQMGIRIAIDDFGTGYSSFSRLNTLSVNILKIDKSFIQDLGHHNADKIVKSMIQLADNLNLQVVAEGVETEAQLQFLIENKCGYVQGFYFSQPLNVAQTTDFLKKCIIL